MATFVMNKSHNMISYSYYIQRAEATLKIYAQSIQTIIY